MFWHTWPRGLKVEPESCSSWRLMSPVAAFEHSDSHSLSEVFLCSPELLCWVVLQGNNFSETSPYLLSPGTDRVNQAAGAFSGEVLWAGVSLLNGKKVHCACTAERKRALWKSAPQAQPLTHPFKAPEHRGMLGTVQAESWSSLPCCLLQLDGYCPILVFLSIFCPHSSLRCGGRNSVCKLEDLDYDSIFANSSVTLCYILVFLQPQFPY